MTVKFRSLALISAGLMALPLVAGLGAVAQAAPPPTPTFVRTLDGSQGWGPGDQQGPTHVTEISRVNDPTYLDGSLHLSVPASADRSQVSHPLATNPAQPSTGLTLPDVASLTYDSMVAQTSPYPATAPGLQVTMNGCNTTIGSTGYTNLNFEPAYNTDQQALTPGQWESWDAINSNNAKWWSSRQLSGLATGVGSQSDPVTWATIKSACPNGFAQSLQVSLGSGTPGAEGYADSVALNGTIYDFANPLPTTVYVSGAIGTDSGTCGASLTTQCATIQRGVDNANPGDTVLVAPGTYNETVNIAKQVALESSGNATNTIIDGTGKAPAISTNYGVVHVGDAGGDVSINGFTIENPIAYDGSDGAPETVTVSDSNSSDTVTISNNTITGNSALDPIGQIGVYSIGAKAAINVTSNDISGVEQGVFFEATAGPNSISGNKIHDLTSDPDFPGEGVFLLSDGSGGNTTMTGQSVTDNTFSGYNGIGIAVNAGYDSAACTGQSCPGSISGAITGNTFDLGKNTTTYSSTALRLKALQNSTLAFDIGDNTGTVVAPTSTIVQVTDTGGTIDLTPTGGPDAIVPVPATTLAVNTPAFVTKGDPAVPFTATTDNSAGPELQTARYGITLKGTSGLTASQVHLTYEADPAGHPGVFLPVPLTGTANGANGITGYFGPVGGFTLPAGATPTTNFKLSIDAGAPVVSLTSTVTLDQVSVGTGNPVINTIATDTRTVGIEAQYVSVTPTRVVDTRITGNPLNNGPLAPNTAYTLDLANTSVPLNKSAYVFNVTGIQPSGVGNLRISAACGNPSPPTTSIVNYQVGKDVANDLVVSNLGSNGLPCNKFTVYSDTSSADVVMDLQGYYTSVSAFAGVAPTRIVDTRFGVGGSTGQIQGGTYRTFQVTGVGGVPAGTPSVAINVTASQPTGVGNLRVYPAGAAVPTTSNVNYVPGVDKAAFAIVKLSSDGKISVYSDNSAVNVVIDVFGYLPTTSNTVVQAPVRVYDSRTAGSPIAVNTPRNVPITTVSGSGVPTGAKAVIVSLTAIHVAGGRGIGYLQAYAGNGAVPTVSNINYIGPNTDVANMAIVPLAADGSIELATGGSPMNAAVDVVGYVPGD